MVEKWHTTVDLNISRYPIGSPNFDIINTIPASLFELKQKLLFFFSPITPICIQTHLAYSLCTKRETKKGANLKVVVVTRLPAEHLAEAAAAAAAKGRQVWWCGGVAMGEGSKVVWFFIWVKEKKERCVLLILQNCHRFFTILNFCFQNFTENVENEDSLFPKFPRILENVFWKCFKKY